MTREWEVARSAAREAGAVLIEHFARPPAATSKADGSPVTDADTEANRVIVRALRAAFPTDAILSEEGNADAAERPATPSGGRLWIVDPLDGTRDFLAGSPDFAVHVALVDDGRPLVAVVHQPAVGLLCDARAGGGAFAERPGQARTRLHVSGVAAPDQVRLGVSVHAPGERLLRLLDETGLRTRSQPIGASVKWLALAAGALEGVLCLHDREKAWDTCAPALIVREAGGRVTDVDGRPLAWDAADVRHHRGFIASNGACHDALLALARRYWPA